MDLKALRLRPWQATLAALAAGVLAALAHPPFGFLPGLLGYALLMYLVDQAPAERPLRSAFWRGWLAAFAYFLIGCWWVAEAFMVDARGQGWMAPIAVALLPAGLGLFWGLAMVLYRVLRPSGPWRAFAFAGALTLLEWLRGHLLTGFPWNLPGESWRAGSAVSQVSALVGAYGLTWLTLLAAAAFATPFGEGGWRKGRWAIAAAICALIAGWSYGELRLREPAGPAPGAPLIRIVQADVPQENKYSDDHIQAILNRYLELTARPAKRRPDIVVWSEGAVPMSANEMLASGSASRDALTRTLGLGQTLLMGSYRVTGTYARPIYFNSLIAVRAGGDGLSVTGVYDKYRLVPFGEYLPAESLLAPLGFKDLTHIADSFTAGSPPAPIAPAGTPAVQPLICYEALFPDLVRDAVRRGPVRPRWIVNVSNDSWFGVTSGPLQHLNMASYRAIETGLPVVRATPTGVSAIIDAHGRIVPGARLGFGATGVIDSELPKPLKNTTYGLLGDSPLAGVLFLTLLTLSRQFWSRLPRLLMAVQDHRKI